MDIQREVQRLTQENQNLKSDITQLKNTIRSHETTKSQLGQMAQKNLHLQQIIVGAGLRC
jgi:prefoldin subunit 5